MRPPAAVITSTRNPRVAAVSRLHRTQVRRQQGRTLLEGPHLLAEAMAAEAAIEVVFAPDPSDPVVHRAAGRGIEIVEVSVAVLARIADTETPRGPVAVIAVPEPSPLRAADTAVLVDVADPGNAGTIVRSAAAFGFDIARTPATVDLWAPKVLRAGAGAHFHTLLSIVGEDMLDSLRTVGLRSVALVSRGGEASLADVGAVPVALLVGSEAHGLDPGLAAAADARLTIPMPGGTESLNAAVAASIAMYEWRLAEGRSATVDRRQEIR